MYPYIKLIDPYPMNEAPRIGIPITKLRNRCSKTVPFPAVNDCGTGDE